jgi:hypothetical protein
MIDGVINKNLERACEMLAVRVLIQGTDDEIKHFASMLHRRLDKAIERTVANIHTKILINQSLNNPQIHEQPTKNSQRT